ncbi:MAG: type VI secretion system protein TssA [Deltaproteobacteria bacterium]
MVREDRAEKLALPSTELLLEPVSESKPTGDNLEYQPEFAELERAARGKPARQMGSAVVPGEPPNYARVIDLASGLLGRSKDLRVAVQLARALLETAGFAGFAAGLHLARGLLERYWDALYPELDPEDGDATMRVAALSALSAPDVVSALRAAPLLNSSRSGPISLRDVAIAAGELAQPPSHPELDQDVIAGSSSDADVVTLEALLAQLRSARTDLEAIRVLLEASPGTSVVEFAPIDRLLCQAGTFLRPHVERLRSGAAASAVVPADEVQLGLAEAERETEVPPSASRRVDAPFGPAAATAGTIRGREDVVHCLDRICEYYAQHEPSSPLPLLLRRCRRLVASSFLDIVRDMAPDALSQIQMITGKTEE